LRARRGIPAHSLYPPPLPHAGVTEEYVGSADELMELVKIGEVHRAVVATGMNEMSSRSHSILTIHVLARDTLNGSARTSRLCLVDLAG
jgi:Kinesin motor domain